MDTEHFESQSHLLDIGPVRGIIVLRLIIIITSITFQSISNPESRKKSKKKLPPQLAKLAPTHVYKGDDGDNVIDMLESTKGNTIIGLNGYTYYKNRITTGIKSIYKCIYAY